MKQIAAKFVIQSIPLGKLPEDYSIRYGKKTASGRLCRRDMQAWRKFQKSRGYTLSNIRNILSKIKPETRAWVVARAYKEPPADGAIFVEYKGEVIACVCVLITKLGTEYHHGVVSPNHRGKGIYKAMTKLAMEYAIKKGYNYLILAPNPELMRFWNRVANMEVVEYDE